MTKRADPLWRIVGEDVRLQGFGDTKGVACPNCGVPVELPGDISDGEQFRCGLCGTLSEIVSIGSVSDDRTAQTVARVSE